MRNERYLSMIKNFFALAFRQLLSAFFSFTLERHKHLCFVDDREIDTAGQRLQRANDQFDASRSTPDQLCECHGAQRAPVSGDAHREMRLFQHYRRAVHSALQIFLQDHTQDTVLTAQWNEYSSDSLAAQYMRCGMTAGRCQTRSHYSTSKLARENGKIWKK